ncbi:MAG: hypothetical protein IT326_03330, partial [Anaerolineae bacterium]|nr:hypothetical protein [Anaerolineae bacterium]
MAGPLFTPYERGYIEQIAAALEAKGYRTFVPHRDVGLSDGFNELSEEERFRTIYHGDHGAL